jgi:hypothetical protein
MTVSSTAATWVWGLGFEKYDYSRLGIGNRTTEEAVQLRRGQEVTEVTDPNDTPAGLGFTLTL